MEPTKSNSLRPVVVALIASCAVLASAGCGSGYVSSGASALPQSAPLSRHAGSWMLPEAKRAKELLYVGDPGGGKSSYGGAIDVFQLRGLHYKLVGQIQDDEYPDGMTTDTAGNLYLTDMGIATEGPVPGDIKVYPKGGTRYVRLIVPASWIPFDIAVGKDGTFYVANIAPLGYFNPGSVSIYPPQASQPSRVLQFPNFQVYGITLHHQTSTFYVSYAGSGSNGEINEFVHARGKPKNLGVSYDSPWGLLEDGSNNLLACSGSGTVNVYAEATGKLVQQISVPGGALWEAFNKSRTKLFVTNFQEVEIFSYPAGKFLGSITQQGWGGRSNYPTGLALWPPPQ
jgi:sugar lactone lactonase YvrE